MTGHTADVFGLPDRGVIRAGAYADLVLFDPATVRDASTYAEPTRPAEGILRNLGQRPVSLCARRGRDAGAGRPPAHPWAQLAPALRRLGRRIDQRHRCLWRLQPEREALLDIQPHTFRVVIEIADREVLPDGQFKILAAHR